VAAEAGNASPLGAAMAVTAVKLGVVIAVTAVTPAAKHGNEAEDDSACPGW